MIDDDDQVRTNEDLLRELRGRPGEAATWTLIQHACMADTDREAAVEQVARDVAMLRASGDLDGVVCHLAYAVAALIKFDEVAAERAALRSATRAEYAEMMFAVARALAEEDAAGFDG